MIVLGVVSISLFMPLNRVKYYKKKKYISIKGVKVLSYGMTLDGSFGRILNSIVWYGMVRKRL